MVQEYLKKIRSPLRIDLLNMAFFDNFQKVNFQNLKYFFSTKPQKTKNIQALILLDQFMTSKINLNLISQVKITVRKSSTVIPSEPICSSQFIIPPSGISYTTIWPYCIHECIPVIDSLFSTKTRKKQISKSKNPVAIIGPSPRLDPYQVKSHPIQKNSPRPKLAQLSDTICFNVFLFFRPMNLHTKSRKNPIPRVK